MLSGLESVDHVHDIATRILIHDSPVERLGLIGLPPTKSACWRCKPDGLAYSDCMVLFRLDVFNFRPVRSNESDFTARPPGALHRITQFSPDRGDSLGGFLRCAYLHFETSSLFESAQNLGNWREPCMKFY